MHAPRLNNERERGDADHRRHPATRTGCRRGAVCIQEHWNPVSYELPRAWDRVCCCPSGFRNNDCTRADRARGRAARERAGLAQATRDRAVHDGDDVLDVVVRPKRVRDCAANRVNMRRRHVQGLSADIPTSTR
jgi:hypothetical protein